MRVASKVSEASVKVYINDILHLHVVRSKFLGLSSWQYETEGMFYIEILLDGNKIAVDYDRRDLWLLVLTELERIR